MMLSRKVALPFRSVFFAVRLQFSSLMEFSPSMQTPYARYDLSSALDTVMSAVE